MASVIQGGIDCDLHPALPGIQSLLPYLNDYWSDQVTTRGMTDLISQSYPPNSPLTSRPDWRPATGKPGSVVTELTKHALDPYGTKFGICNPLWGVQMVFSEDMTVAFCAALNDWLAKEWLDKDSRLRGSIVVPLQSAEKAVAEIERCAADKRFVQVLMRYTILGRMIYAIGGNADASRLAGIRVEAVSINYGQRHRKELAVPLHRHGSCRWRQPPYVASRCPRARPASGRRDGRLRHQGTPWNRVRGR